MSRESDTPDSEVSAQTIIEGFTALAGLGAENGENAHSWLSSESLFVVAALERKIVGLPIHITELPSSRELGQRAISRWGKKNESQIIGAPEPGVVYSDLRTHPKTGIRYIRNASFTFAKSGGGIIEAVDAQFQSLIIKPTISRLWWDRNWVKILGPDGEPLVDLEL